MVSKIPTPKSNNRRPNSADFRYRASQPVPLVRLVIVHTAPIHDSGREDPFIEKAATATAELRVEANPR